MASPAGDGFLTPDTAPATDTRNFSISRLVFQARYRWEIAPLSDLLSSTPEDLIYQIVQKRVLVTCSMTAGLIERSMSS